MFYTAKNKNANIKHKDKELNTNQVCITGCWYPQISLIVEAAFSIWCIIISPKTLFTLSIFHIY